MPHPLLSAVDALLIDLDGTLVDSTAPVTRAWSGFADAIVDDLGELLGTA